MPTKDDPRITIRVTQDEHDLLKQAAEKDGLSLSELVRRGALARLHPGDQRNWPESARPAGYIDEAFRKIPGNGPTIMGPPSLHCPMPGCDFTAKSPAAKCPTHGRTVR